MPARTSGNMSLRRNLGGNPAERARSWEANGRPSPRARWAAAQTAYQLECDSFTPPAPHLFPRRARHPTGREVMNVDAQMLHGVKRPVHEPEERIARREAGPLRPGAETAQVVEAGAKAAVQARGAVPAAVVRVLDIPLTVLLPTTSLKSLNRLRGVCRNVRRRVARAGNLGAAFPGRRTRCAWPSAGLWHVPASPDRRPSRPVVGRDCGGRTHFFRLIMKN